MSIAVTSKEFDSGITENTDQGYVQLFEAWARRTPEVTAVCFEGQSLTYAELNRRANRLATFLLKTGMKQQQLIGVYARRSIDSIIGFLGILKAGCVYLPLSLKYPSQRLKYIAGDAEISVLLTQEKYKENLAGLDIPRICLDSDWESVQAESGENPGIPYNPEHLAYVIYTSGTSGQPKGVKIKCDSLLNLHASLNHIIFNDSAKPHYNCGFYSALDFDMSFKQLLQLLNGYTLHIIPEEMRMDVNGTINFIQKNEIHVFDCPTPVIKVLIHAGLLHNQKHNLQKVLFGGEAVDAATWKTMAGENGVEFYNMYGPTECTVDATITRVSSETETPHIGKPVLNTDIFLLDENMEEVDINIPGEIHVGGRCLAEGYLNNEALTREKFVFASIGARQNLRLYKTGDLARYLPDRRIEYIGRADKQVKIRGYRIEITEIEAVIQQFAGISSVIVRAIEQKATNDIASKVLVAYLLPGNNEQIDTGKLRQFVLEKLPEYMVPAAFLLIDRIPLTSNGKTDYAALPLPEWNDHHAPADRPAEDLSLLEKHILELWKQLLDVEHLAVTDNFFEKGGHSLAAMQITAEMEEYLETEIPLISLFFSGPTAREFAVAIEENLENPEELDDILAELTGAKA